MCINDIFCVLYISFYMKDLNQYFFIFYFLKYIYIYIYISIYLIKNIFIYIYTNIYIYIFKQKVYNMYAYSNKHLLKINVITFFIKIHIQSVQTTNNFFKQNKYREGLISMVF